MGRQCWICLEEEHQLLPLSHDDRWLRPCQCKGSTGWVHESCLLSWVNSRLATTSNRLAQHAGGPLASPPLSCPQCRFPYKIIENGGGLMIPQYLLRWVDGVLEVRDGLIFVSMLGAMAGGFCVASWASGTAILFTVLGPDEASTWFARYGMPLYHFTRYLFRYEDMSWGWAEVGVAWWKSVLGVALLPVAIVGQQMNRRLSLYLAPILLLDGLLTPPLPLSPRTVLSLPSVSLLALPYIDRAYTGLRRRLFVRIIGDSTPLNGSFTSTSTSLPSPSSLLDEDAEDEALIRVAERSVVSLFIFPAVASLLGWALLHRSNLRPLHRTLIGGAILTVTADVGRLLYRHQAAYSRQHRRVLEYDDL